MATITAATCHKSRYGVIFRCPVAEDLWEAVNIARDFRLVSDTEYNRKLVEVRWQNYQAHVEKCVGGKHDTSKS